MSFSPESIPEVQNSVDAMLEWLVETSQDNIRIIESFPNLENNDTLGFASKIEEFFLSNEKTAPMIQAFHDKALADISIG